MALRAKPKKKYNVKPRLPAVPVVVPTEPMPGFSSFAAKDYAVAVPGKTPGSERYLTVSPLRAIMAEQAGIAHLDHEPTDRTREGVMYAAGLGIERKVIAKILGIEVDVLEEHYDTELNTAVHLLMNDIQTNVYNVARDPHHPQSMRAAVFMLGKLGGELYREEKRRESTALIDPRTRTIPVEHLSDEQRLALKDILQAAMRLAAPNEYPEGEYVEIEAERDNDAGDLL